MKIDYVLVGSNDNPMYLEFWPIFAKIWKTKFNVTPVLGFIGDDSIKIDEEYGIVYRFDKIQNYDSGLLSQLVRLYLPKFLNGNCLISDIDMIPLSKSYFIDDVEKYNDNDFLIMSSHHPQTVDKTQYPMCYVLGNDTNYKKIFKLDDDWTTFISKIQNNGWFTDQEHLYKMINECNDINFVFPERQNGFYSNRVDRCDWYYEIDKLKSDYYVDSHLLRPYSFYKEEIDKLVDLL